MVKVDVNARKGKEVTKYVVISLDDCSVLHKAYESS